MKLAAMDASSFLRMWTNVDSQKQMYGERKRETERKSYNSQTASWK